MRYHPTKAIRPTTNYQLSDIARGIRAAYAQKIETKLNTGEIPFGNRSAIRTAIKRRSNILACRAARKVDASKVDAMIANRPLCRPPSKSSSEE